MLSPTNVLTNSSSHMKIVKDLANGVLPYDILMIIYCKAIWSVYSEIEELIHCKKCVSEFEEEPVRQLNYKELNLLKHLLYECDDESQLKYWMCGACIRGNLVFAKLIHSVHNLSFTYIELRNLLTDVCGWGQVPVLQWMHEVYSLDFTHIVDLGIRYDMTTGEAQGKLLSASSQGHFNMAKHLQKTYNLTADDALKGERFHGPRHPFFCATINGHVKTAKWLYCFFNLKTRKDECDIEEAFICVNGRGYAKMVKWLLKIKN